MLAVVLYAGLIALLYYDGLTHMVRGWGSEDYNYCYLVPVVILYMIWEKRDALMRVPVKVSGFGFLLFLPAFALFWLGELGGEYLTLYLSAWLLVMALVWIRAGWRRFKVILFPLLMIPAMFPLPSFLHNRLSLKLKLISSQIGVEMMQMAGMSAYREGNVIDLGFTQLQVVDACSGLRYLFPIIILGLLLAWFFRAPLWKRLLLVISTLPLIILTNSFRIAATGLLYEPFGPKVAEGFFHDFSGWLIFMVTLVILLLEMWLLNKLPGHLPETSFAGSVAGKSGSFSSSSASRGQKIALVVAAVLLLLTWSISRGVEFREKIPVVQPLNQFTLTFIIGRIKVNLPT